MNKPEVYSAIGILIIAAAIGTRISIKEKQETEKWYKEQYPQIIQRCLDLNGNKQKELSQKLGLKENSLEPEYYPLRGWKPFIVSGGYYNPSAQKTKRILREYKTKTNDRLR